MPHGKHSQLKGVARKPTADQLAAARTYVYRRPEEEVGRKVLERRTGLDGQVGVGRAGKGLDIKCTCYDEDLL